jgi:ribose-phosphate pyrophosphokinase
MSAEASTATITSRRAQRRRMMLVGGRGYPELTEQVAKHLDVAITPQSVYDFASGEIFVRFEESVRGADVFVVQSVGPALNKSLIETLIMVDTLKRASAERITVILPFYPYARQDKKHRGREPVSARLVSDLLATAGAHRLITVDLHADQIQGFFDGPVDHLLAQSLLVDHIVASYSGRDLTVVSPDAGRLRSAERWADHLGGVPLAFVHKTRDPKVPNQVVAHRVVGDVGGRLCVLIDDDRHGRHGHERRATAFRRGRPRRGRRRDAWCALRPRRRAAVALRRVRGRGDQHSRGARRPAVPPDPFLTRGAAGIAETVGTARGNLPQPFVGSGVLRGVPGAAVTAEVSPSMAISARVTMATIVYGRTPVQKKSISRTGWAKRLIMTAPVAGLAAGAVAVTAFAGQAQAGTASNARLAASSTAHRAAGVVHCPTTLLRISFGKPARTRLAQQYQVPVTLLNRGHTTCRLAGYPGMDLVGDGGDIRLSVPRERESYSAINLRPNHYTSFTLTYVLETPQQVQGELGAWGPDTVVITSPNSISHQTLKWSLGPVNRYSVRPGGGTYLSPVGR